MFVRRGKPVFFFLFYTHTDELNFISADWLSYAYTHSLRVNSLFLKYGHQQTTGTERQCHFLEGINFPRHLKGSSEGTTWGGTVIRIHLDTWTEYMQLAHIPVPRVHATSVKNLPKV